MQNHHIHRILGPLGDPHSLKIIADKKYGGILETNHFTQWKWFYRDIGKHVCVSALLPFADTALHKSLTYLPEHYKGGVESYDALQNRIHLITNWIEKPTKENKSELFGSWQKSKPDQRFGLDVSPSENFINLLAKIVVTKQKFPMVVYSAFYYLRRMGYDDAHTKSVFRAEVLAIYQERLAVCQAEQE